MLNLETIGGTIIEAHLRFADQWPDLYGPGWVDAVVGLYERGEWEFADDDRCEGYSVVLFGPNGRRYRHPPPACVEEIRRMPGVSSVQITFHEDREPERTPCRPAAFASPSSTALTCAPRSRRASGSRKAGSSTLPLPDRLIYSRGSATRL